MHGRDLLCRLRAQVTSAMNYASGSATSVLRSKRRVLRPFVPEDSNRLAELADNPRIADTMISVAHPYSLDEARDDIARYQIESQTNSAVHFAIALLENPEDFFGYVALKHIDHEHKECELSFWIDESHEGKGYMTEGCSQSCGLCARRTQTKPGLRVSHGSSFAKDRDDPGGPFASTGSQMRCVRGRDSVGSTARRQAMNINPKNTLWPGAIPGRLCVMEAAAVLCMWCKGNFEPIDGPVHEYIESTPGCWSTYSKVLAVEYENYQELRDVHRLTVDTYAVQHPGQPSRKSIQSVWGHLVAQHLYLKRGLDGEKTRLRLERFVDISPELVWLPPPDFTGALNIGHVANAADNQDHIRRVKEWGSSVYSCWHQMHAVEIEGMIQRLVE